MLSSLLYACVLLIALSIAMGRGSDAERRVGIVLLAGNLATLLAIGLNSVANFTFVSVTYLTVDVLASLALCFVACGRPSWMAILIASFQINGTLAHIVKLLAPETLDLSYAILLRIWGWPMVLTLLLAHWKGALQRVLRQSDALGLPRPLRPPIKRPSD